MNENQNVEEVLKLIEAEILKIGEIISDFALLESELKIKKTKLNKSLTLMEKYFVKFNIKDFDDEAKGKLLDLRERINPPYDNPSILQKIRWERMFNEEQEIKDWKINVFFDCPKPLKIHISYPDFSSKEIDIIESIKKDINNIGHPLILKAIERYQKKAILREPTKEKKFLPNKSKIPLDSDDAHLCLEEISKALKKPNVPKKEINQLKNFFKMKHISDYGIDYFEKIIELLKSDSVRNSRTISNKKMYLRMGLEKAFPNIENKEILSWLESRLRNNLMPKRLDENTLKNDFWAWRLNVKRDSAKTYLSNLKKFGAKVQGIGFTKDKEEEMTKDVMFYLLGIIEMPDYHLISSLVTDKEAFADLDISEIAPPE